VIKPFGRLMVGVLFLNTVLCFAGDLYSVSDLWHRITELSMETEQALELMEEYSRGRIEYFRKGLGWRHAEEGIYGFFTGGRQVFYAENYRGFEERNEDGVLIRRFTLEPWENGIWIILVKPGEEKLAVRFSGGRGDRLFYVSNTGQEILFSADLVQNKLGPASGYPGELLYGLNLVDSEHQIYLSPDLRNLLYETPMTVDERNRLAGLLDEDFPNQYYTRSLMYLVESGMDLSNRQVAAEGLTAFYREFTDLPEIRLDSRIEEAARSHAEYVLRNGVGNRLEAEGSFDNLNVYLALHDETPGFPGFTGATPNDRGKAAGYPGFTGECAAMTSDPVSAHFIWYHTLFHRRPYIDPRVIHTGQGIAWYPGAEEAGANIMNWGYDFNIRHSGYVLYPGDGMTSVPWVWRGYEAPDPFPSHNNPVGVPISVFSTEEMYTKGHLRLFDEGGRELPLIKSPVIPDPLFLEAVPARPLEPDTDYTIVFEYQGGSDRHLFRTAPEEDLMLGYEEVISRLKSPSGFNTGFDIAAAMEENGRKGELVLYGEDGINTVIDTKYNFQFTLPEGWELRTDQWDWQEVIAGKDWMTINFHVFLHYGKSPDNLMDEQLSYIDYLVKDRSEYSNGYFTVELAEYEWEYTGRAFTAVGKYTDFAMVIHGWGTTENEFRTILDSFGPVE
jgi:hypothetical protein